MAITLPITSRTASDDNDFSDVYGNDAQLVTEIDARDSVYRALLSSAGHLEADFNTAQEILFRPGPSSDMATDNTNLAHTGGVTDPQLIYLVASDYSVSSKTTKLRLRAQVAANGTAPGINFTFGLYPLTVSGSADALVYTAGTVVSGSTVAINTPSANTITSGTGADFTFPSDGAYALGLTISGALANNNWSSVFAHLQIRWV